GAITEVTDQQLRSGSTLRAMRPKLPNDIILATHYWSPGWASALGDYLKPRIEHYRWIGHPMYVDGSAATYNSYLRGDLVKSLDVPGGRGPLRYLKDIFRTLVWARQEGPADLFIA